MSLQTIGFRVVRRPKRKVGGSVRTEPLTRVYHSRDAANDACALARRAEPDADIYVEAVQAQEGRKPR